MVGTIAHYTATEVIAGDGIWAFVVPGGGGRGAFSKETLQALLQFTPRKKPRKILAACRASGQRA
jgi:hypothetical protein